MSTHNIPFSNIKKKISLNIPKSETKGFFLGAQERETAVVNEQSVFEPLKFYCTWSLLIAMDSIRLHN